MKLVLATDEQKRARDRVAYRAWGGQLSLDGYLERERRLRGHPWAQRTMSSWFLVGDEGDDEVLASCEIYRMDGWQRAVRGDVWAVASVFTEERLRGRGFATALIDRIVEQAQAEGALASILYSDVAPRQYERSGYRLRPAQDLLFAPIAGDAAATADALIAEGPIDDGAAPVPPATIDQELIVWPSAAQLDWHVERTRSYAALLQRPALPWVGARAGAGEIRWAVDWKRATLKVSLLATARADEAATLLRAAQQAAGALGLREMMLWAQPWPFAPESDLGGRRVARSDSLPMIAPLVPSLPAGAWQQIPFAVWC